MVQYITSKDRKPRFDRIIYLRVGAHREDTQYEFERRKYAQDLINFDKKFSKLFSGKPRTENNQDGVTHEDFIEYVSPHPVLLFVC